MSLSEHFDPWSANGGELPASVTPEDEPIATEQSGGSTVDPRFEKTYVVIDGLDKDELTDEEAERLERHVLEFALTEIDGAMPTGVRVIKDGKGVVEIDYSDEEDNAVDE